MIPFTESVVEGAALAWLESIGWRTAHGPDIAARHARRRARHYWQVVLAQRLRDALARLNPLLPFDALHAVRFGYSLESTAAVRMNRRSITA